MEKLDGLELGGPFEAEEGDEVVFNAGDGEDSLAKTG